jgi:ankyrin repeat protein
MCGISLPFVWHRVVQALLDSGADVNAGDEFGTATTVSQRYHMNVFEGVLGRHVECVHLCAVLYQRQTHFGDQLRAGANFEGTTPLHYAVLAGDERIVQMLLDAREWGATDYS